MYIIIPVYLCILFYKIQIKKKKSGVRISAATHILTWNTTETTDEDGICSAACFYCERKTEKKKIKKTFSTKCVRKYYICYIYIYNYKCSGWDIFIRGWINGFFFFFLRIGCHCRRLDALLDWSGAWQLFRWIWFIEWQVFFFFLHTGYENGSGKREREREHFKRNKNETGKNLSAHYLFIFIFFFLVLRIGANVTSGNTKKKEYLICVKYRYYITKRRKALEWVNLIDIFPWIVPIVQCLVGFILLCWNCISCLPVFFFFLILTKELICGFFFPFPLLLALQRAPKKKFFFFMFSPWQIFICNKKKKAYGVKGSFHSSSGFDSTPGDALWPWPNEDALRFEFCDGTYAQDQSSGFCIASILNSVDPATLTHYVWEYLGSPIPEYVLEPADATETVTTSSTAPPS